ncbi:single-strand selective monofunctional uracil DNA glycosylase-like [Musca autumnalis]|uniref:single-strand selective monofunctional uracil DNA glycosylase-like n=1 Tax=Musca autumnalis TaxID=221902 RepID=UPI003CEEC5F8
MELENELNGKLNEIKKPPGYVSKREEIDELESLGEIPNIFVYNPLEYAAEIRLDYLRKCLNERKKILFVGMNPAADASLQTGIPLCTRDIINNHLSLTGNVKNPPRLYPRITITGLNNEENDNESSIRFWKLIKELFKDCEDFVDRFFQQCFIHNFCPLVYIGGRYWMNGKWNGRNVSMEKLIQKSEDSYAKEVEAACLNSMDKQVNLLQPDIIICIGAYVYNMLSELKGCENKLILIPPLSPKQIPDSSEWVKLSKYVLAEHKVFSEEKLN